MFGVTSGLAEAPQNIVQFTEKWNVSYTGGADAFTFSDSPPVIVNGNVIFPAQTAMQNAMLWFGDQFIKRKPGQGDPGAVHWNWVAVPGAYDSYTHHLHEFTGGGAGAGWTPQITPGAGYAANVTITQGNGVVTVTVSGSFSYTVRVAKAYPGANHVNAHAQ